MRRPVRARLATARYSKMLIAAAIMMAGCRQQRSTGGTAADTTPSDVVRRYYAAIQAGDYASAYELWGNGGQSSGKSRREFAAGFAQTARVSVTLTDSTRIEGAAGSRYATVPVRVDAVLRDGRQQQFTGTYTLRRSMVDGATPEQRRWTIYKADLRER